MTDRPWRGREAYKVWRTIGTRWSDNDVYGHVNNTVHYGWFDTAVNGWLIEAGLLDIAAGDPIGLVVETGCRYARALTYPQPVEVGLAIEHLGKFSVRYILGIFAEDEHEASAEGFFVHVYVNRESRRGQPIPETWREKLDSIKIP